MFLVEGRCVRWNQGTTQGDDTALAESHPRTLPLLKALMDPYHLIIVGFDEIVSNKYLGPIHDAIREGQILKYSILDLDSASVDVTSRLKAMATSTPPARVTFIPDSDAFSDASAEWLMREVHGAGAHDTPVRVYIATEARAHLSYLSACVEAGIDCLVEKPVFAPLSKEGVFEPSGITSTMYRLIRQAEASRSQNSVMTLGRYHEIFNDRFIDIIEVEAMRLASPVTSVHLQVSGGVWNRETEYQTRDDHPYKYGYGMMMHGAYHYLDILSQIIAINSRLVDGDSLDLELVAFGAFPRDQSQRLGPAVSALLDDGRVGPAELNHMGETDAIAAFRLTSARTGRTVTLGSAAFEQTTPSMRHWSEFPEGEYNKNGRMSRVQLDAQLSTVLSAAVDVYDVPSPANGREALGEMSAIARLDVRANPLAFPDRAFITSQSFDGIFHRASNRALLENWVRGIETRSSLRHHLLPMALTEQICLALRYPGSTWVTRLYLDEQITYATAPERRP